MSYQCYLCLFVYGDVKQVLIIWASSRVSYKRQELPILFVGRGSGFGGIRFAHLFSFLWFVVFFDLCHVYPILPLSLSCPFLIAASVSLKTIINNCMTTDTAHVSGEVYFLKNQFHNPLLCSSSNYACRFLFVWWKYNLNSAW